MLHVCCISFMLCVRCCISFTFSRGKGAHDIRETGEKDPLNLNCSSYSSCFLSFCSCSRSKRERGSYSSSGASGEQSTQTYSTHGCSRSFQYFRGVMHFESLYKCILTLWIIRFSDFLPLLLSFLSPLIKLCLRHKLPVEVNACFPSPCHHN